MDTPSRSAVLEKKKKKKKERKFIIYEQKIDHTSQTEQLTHLSNWSFLGFGLLCYLLSWSVCLLIGGLSGPNPLLVAALILMS